MCCFSLTSPALVSVLVRRKRGKNVHVILLIPSHRRQAGNGFLTAGKEKQPVFGHVLSCERELKLVPLIPESCFDGLSLQERPEEFFIGLSGLAAQLLPPLSPDGLSGFRLLLFLREPQKMFHTQI